MIAHCELMGDRVAILDPPPGLNAQQIKEWRVDKAGYDSKYAALYWPWIKVVDPATGTTQLHAAERAHGRHLGPQRRHPRRAQGARQRGGPRRDRRSRCRSPRTSTTCSTRSASTASAPSPAAASGSGAPAPCPPTRPGATSTSAGCSTTSRSRSSTAPMGGLRAERRRAVGHGSAARSPRSWSTSGARARCSGSPRTRRSTSSATGRPTRAEGIDAGQVVCEIGVAPVKPAEFVDLPAVPVLRRHQPGQRVTRHHTCPER